MKAIKLLEVDFSKHDNCTINGVFLAGMEINAQENEEGEVVIRGKKDGDLTMMISFSKDSKIHIVEREGIHLSIREMKE